MRPSLCAAWSVLSLALVLACGEGSPGPAGADEIPTRAKTPAPPLAYPRPAAGQNLLALEPSPYLQLHAHNPVDWYPWSEEAFARARAEHKPIFLSVGYSTCYWCHVMEREVFSRPEIAALMNADFVSIKVDREERPDVDELYMKATHLLTGSGGWPNSVFLTPDGRPFYAGTYFPPEDGYGRPGFPKVLRSLRLAWIEDREGVERAAEEVAAHLVRLADPAGGASHETPSGTEAMREAIARLRAAHDPVRGGFGGRTRFPQAPVLELLVTRLEQQRDGSIESMLVGTLDAIALGGIHDQLAGGFHRYSTEPSWSIPHFEKMLYDSAQLLGVYARAYALTERPLYRHVVERTAAYLDREMSHPEGGFTSAQDAEVDGVEGASYLWSPAEIEQILGPERAKAFLSRYELAPMPERSGLGVLRVRLPLGAGLEGSQRSDGAEQLAAFEPERAELLRRRALRKQPLRDDKVLAAWNGLAIRSLVQAARSLEQPAHLRRAERAAHFVLARLRAPSGELRRSYIAGQARELGVLDDYAFLADGLLSLHEATGDARWLDAACELADRMLARFEDPQGGGFFLSAEDAGLFVRIKPFEDAALPSGNAIALRVLRALAARTGSERYTKAAAATLSAAAPLLHRAPQSVALLVAALAREPSSSPASSNPAITTQARARAHAREFQLPGSEAHVRASLVPDPGDPLRRLVRVVLDEGWHVNANPASLPFLIATSVEALGGEALPATYPAGRPFRPGFAREEIAVYEGRFEIALGPHDGAPAPDRLALRFQACDERSCLPPARSVLSLETPTAEPNP
jgi:hypothetical protein